MHCTGFGSGDIGGTQNLFDLGTCPDTNLDGPTCVTKNSHTSTSAAFFKNGGKYRYDDNKFVGINFEGNPEVTCANNKTGGKRKRDARIHGYVERANARRFIQLIGGVKV